MTTYGTHLPTNYEWETTQKFNYCGLQYWQQYKVYSCQIYNCVI